MLNSILLLTMMMTNPSYMMMMNSKAFTTFRRRKVNKNKKKSVPTPKQTTVVVEEEKEKYYLEIGAIAFIIIYSFNFYFGKNTNQFIAQKWLAEFKSIFELQFAALGAYEGTKEGGLLKESHSSYKFYSSGRRFCSGMLCTLDLRKRHNLFSLLLALFDLSTVRDTLTMEIPMNEEDMEPFVFAIVRKKEEKKIKKNQKDLENYAGLVKSTSLPSNLSILTDCPELQTEFVDERVIRAITGQEDLFVLLHLTDQNISNVYNETNNANTNISNLYFSQQKKLLRFVFNLPTVKEMDRLSMLIKMAIHFVDRVASKKLSAQARTRAVNQRKIVAEKLYRATHAQRQEAYAKRKEEEKKKKEESQPELTKEQQRKRDEKEYKASLKRKQPKVKMIR